MKKSFLAFVAGGLTMLAVGAALPATSPVPAPQNENFGRFLLRDTQDIVLVDTHTGEVWRHLTDWKSLGKPSGE